MNPVVAVILGATLGGETLGRRTILGTALILISVAAITMIKRKQLVPANANVGREAGLNSAAD